ITMGVVGPRFGRDELHVDGYVGPRDTIAFARDDIDGAAIYLAAAADFTPDASFAPPVARKIAMQFGPIREDTTFLERVESFAWTPDGRRLYYLVDRIHYPYKPGADERVDLWSINTDGTDRRREA